MKRKFTISALIAFIISGTAAFSQFTNVGSFGAISPGFPAVEKDGSVYGITGNGTGAGVLYKYCLSETCYTELATFTSNGAVGTPAFSPLYNNRVYGITNTGGTNSTGSIFYVNTGDYSVNTVYNFPTTSSALKNPLQIIIDGGTIYGATQYGTITNKGGLFKISADGLSYSSLKSFNSTSGYQPGPLIKEGDIIYGMNSQGGTGGGGNIFTLDVTDNTWTVIKSFNSGTGANSPIGGLVMADNVLYGMTTKSNGVSGDGVIFKINPNGTGYTVLHTFSSSTDGSTPKGTLTLLDGKLYGVTATGGAYNSGTIFSWDIAAGEFTKWHDFRPVNNAGFNPIADHLLYYNYKLYGLTQSGGENGTGVLYSFKPVLPLAIALEDQGICAGKTNATLGPSGDYVFGGVEPFTYSWSPSTGLDDATKKNPLFTTLPTEPTQYVCTVTDALDSTIKDTIMVSIGTMSIDPVGKYYYPKGSTFYLGNFIYLQNGHPPFTIHWTGTNGFEADYNAITSEPAITGTVRELYYVIVKDSYGCECQGKYLLWPR